MDVSILTALVGGALALLSPCGALLLPAYLASSTRSRLGLLGRSLLFWAGLCTTLVPLGLGAGLLGSLLTRHHGLIVGSAAVLLIALGVWQLLGGGFDLARLLPRRRRGTEQVGAVAVGGSDRMTGRGASAGRAFLLGATGGVAGFCAGPILGAVLTVAAAQGDVLRAGLLLAVYAAGTVLPLAAIALAWERLGDRGRRALRGRTVTIGRWTVHSTTLVSGLLMIGLGVLFWVTDGLLALPSLVPASVSDGAAAASAAIPAHWADAGVVLVLGAVAILAWWVVTGRIDARRTEADR